MRLPLIGEDWVTVYGCVLRAIACVAPPALAARARASLPVGVRARGRPLAALGQVCTLRGPLSLALEHWRNKGGVKWWKDLEYYTTWPSYIDRHQSSLAHWVLYINSKTQSLHCCRLSFCFLKDSTGYIIIKQYQWNPIWLIYLQKHFMPNSIAPYFTLRPMLFMVND